MNGWHKVLVETIKSGIERNEIKKDVDPNSAATMLICSFEGTRGIRKIYDDDKLFENYLKAVKIFIKTIST